MAGDFLGIWAQKAIVIMFYCGYNYGCSGSYNF
jgi:hypothetical protein